MKVLMIADGQSIFTAKYVERVLIPLGCQVTVLTSEDVPPAFASSYASPCVRVVREVGPHQLLRRIPLVRRLSLRFRNRSRLGGGDFDVIHVHFATLRRVRLAFMVKGKRRVISFWGSDLLRRTPDQLGAMRGFLARVQNVTVVSTGMRMAFLRHYGDLGITPVVLSFGVNGLDAIDRVREVESRDQALRRFEFPGDRLIVTVGYNGHAQQQHLMMLRAISGLTENLKAKLHLVLPMTYGGDESYIQEVRTALAATGCSGTVLTQFLGEEDQARLSIATDLFIHAQTTDALSASLQEFIYAGAIVLNGSWLQYPELSEAGVNLHEFSTEEDLMRLIALIISAGASDDQWRQVNSEAMRARSWGAVAARWAAIYENTSDNAAPL